MFPYPLDQEVIQIGIDTSLPDSTKAYYAAVPVGYDFCDSVEFEVLKELFIVEPFADSLDSMISMAKTSSISPDPFLIILNAYGITPMELDMEALRITGNLENRMKGVDTTGFGSPKRSAWFSYGWRPSGTITYQDNILGVTPVVGARVTAGYWYSWRSSTTNSNGYFSSPTTWTWSVDYHLHFDAGDFVFQKNGMREGPHATKSAWNINLTDKWGTVAACFAAAWNYYYGGIDDLNRPHQNGVFSVKLDLEIKDEEFDNDASAYHSVVPWFSQSITVFLKSSHTHTYISSIEAFTNTTHELAHNAHFQHFSTRNWAVPRDFEWVYNIDSKVKESFAAGVEWRIMNMRYGARDRNYGYFGNYTGICEDLIDLNSTYAQRGYLGTGKDRVQGFTIKQIENATVESFSFDELRDNLKSKYPNGSSTGLVYSEPDFDSLFEYWSGI